MKRSATPAEAACTCGAVQVRVHAALTRFSCHCTICQRVAASPLSVVVGPAWRQPELMPATRGHAFTETRAADIDDELPQHDGYLASQAAITGWILGGVFGS